MKSKIEKPNIKNPKINSIIKNFLHSSKSFLHDPQMMQKWREGWEYDDNIMANWEFKKSRDLAEYADNGP